MKSLASNAITAATNVANEAAKVAEVAATAAASTVQAATEAAASQIPGTDATELFSSDIVALGASGQYYKTF